MYKWLVIILMLIYPSVGLGAGTCVEDSRTSARLNNALTGDYVVVIKCTADAADNSFPVYTVANVGGFLMPSVVFTPGSPAPTSGMAVTVFGNGDDLLEANGASITTTAKATISTTTPQLFAGDLTITPTGNSVASAVFYIKLPLAN